VGAEHNLRSFQRSSPAALERTMTLRNFWTGVESGSGWGFRILRGLLILAGAAILVFLGVLPLTWQQQTFLGAVLIAVAIWLGRASQSYLVTLTLIVMSLFATFRYAVWRIGAVVGFFTNPASHYTFADAAFVIILVGAEAYAFSILFLGFFQTIWPLRRPPVAMPDDTDQWPHVDLLIPTYNEPLSLVRYTAMAALNIDWPIDRLHVSILDDGNRAEFRDFAEEAGIGYVTRNNNDHAKAGNINQALAKMTSPYVAIFDCDHVPTRSFLQITMGWFLRDKKLGMLQTPHHFYSPDPFERNLGQFRVIPNEGELFYGVVQDGNDLWNATFFCGSCAVLRRTALNEIGGIAVETVTEDAHTSLRMQIRGWNTAYINIPQAAGLATERLSGHVKQRVRWARGMIQILRTDNPLTAKSLKWPQRLCYFNAMTHFLYALPRLIFLTAPLVYLLFGVRNIPGYWAAIMVFALPHLFLSNIANSRIQGEHRHSFWNEIYETVLAPYILVPTLFALVNPKLGKFNVTDKGGVVEEAYYDTKIARPFLFLMGLNVLGLLMIIPRVVHIPGLEFLWDGNHPGTISMNALWTVFNMIILGAANAVARESRQMRERVRIRFAAPVSVKVGDQIIQGETIDVSSGGVALTAEDPVDLKPGQRVEIIFPVRFSEARFPAQLVESEGKVLRAKFDALSITEEKLLTMVLYSRADAWIGWGETRERDHPLRSFARICILSVRGIAMSFSIFTPKRSGADKKKAAAGLGSTGAALLAFLALFLVGGVRCAQAVQTTHSKQNAVGASPNQPAESGAFTTTMTLKDLGSSNAIDMQGVESYHPLYFSLPQNELVSKAVLNLNYAFSPSLIASMSQIKVILNGNLIQTIQMSADAPPGLQTQTIDLPADYLVRRNELNFEFIGHYTTACEDPANTVLWSRIEPSTSITLSGSLLPLSSNLKFLPAPFFDPALAQARAIPFAFAAAPGPKALEAAGILSSYFGKLGNARSMRFPISIGTIPAGNVVLIAENPESLPESLDLGTPIQPTIAVRTNPSDPYGKVLIVTGATSDQMVEAAQAVALGWNGLQGKTAAVQSFDLPAPRKPDDAPSWSLTGRKVALWNYNSSASLQGDGSAPIETYFRLPPDLYFGTKQYIPLLLAYRYNPVPLGKMSTMAISANGSFVGSVPFPPGDKTSRTEKTRLALPITDLRPFSNSLVFNLAFQWRKNGNCQDTIPGNMRGAILSNSYLDIGSFPHWTAMPNLELFANAGFPFTRYADLSHTEVVMPTSPTPDEISLYLAMMGHFAAETGYPVMRVTVGGPNALHRGAKKNFLVIATGHEGASISRLNPYLPVKIHESGVTVEDTSGFFARVEQAWWKHRNTNDDSSGTADLSGVPDAVIEGIESPFASGRSVVLIDVNSSADFAPLIATFLNDAQSSAVMGTVSVLHGKQFQSFNIHTRRYHVGHLPWWMAIDLFFIKMPWLVDVVVVLVAFLFAVLLRSWLRSYSRRRLEGGQ
jgi:cellulose synthase (UDP-forming)